VTGAATASGTPFAVSVMIVAPHELAADTPIIPVIRTKATPQATERLISFSLP
jgi:hypothetical protein